jgi:hypothetical protein
MNEAPERISEVAEILAAGLMRLRAAKSSRKSAETGESSLDFTATESAHAEPIKSENSA